MSINLSSPRLTLISISIFMLTFNAVVTDVSAGRRGSKQDKSGVLNNSLFVDSAYKFSVRLRDGWKERLESSESDVRLTMIQKHTGSIRSVVPTRMQFTIIEGNNKASEVVDSVASQESSWKQSKSFWADIRPTLSGTVMVGKLNVRSRTPVSVAGRTASSCIGRVNFDLGGGGGTNLGADVQIYAVDMQPNVLLVTLFFDSRDREQAEKEKSEILAGVGWLQ